MSAKMTEEDLYLQRINTLEQENAALRKDLQNLRNDDHIHRLVLANISDAVVLTDTIGNFIYICPNINYIFGLSQEAVFQLGKIEKLVNGTIVDPTTLIVQNEINNIPRTIVDNDGRERRLLITAKAVKLDRNAVLYVMRDMTEYEQAEEERRKAVERLNQAQRMARLGYWDWEPATHTLTWSDEVYAIFGQNRETFHLTTKSFEACIHPDDRGYFIDAREAALRQNRAIDIEHRIIRPDGTVRHVQELGLVVRDANGVVARVSGTLQDITAHKETENALRQSKRDLKLTLEATTDGIWTWNFKTNELSFSPKYYTMLGYEVDEFPADFDHWINLIHPDDQDQVLEKAQAYLQTKPDLYENEFRLQTKDGDYRWIHAHARVAERDENGEAVYMIGNHLDITARKLAEEKLKAYVYLLERLDIIDRIVRGGTDAEQVMGQALEALVKMFNCDRAWLLYPCDPEADGWSVPFERTRPDFPGLFDRRAEIPMTADVARRMREVLAAKEPIAGAFQPGEPEYDPKDALSIRSYLIMALQPQSGQPWEFGVHQCSHARVWTDQEKTLFREISGRIRDALSILLVLRDLKASEQKFRSLVESSSDWIWAINAQGEYTYASPQVESILGFHPDEIIGKSIFDCMPPGEAKRNARLFDNAINAREPIINLENIRINRHGRPVFLETSCVPIFDDSGELCGYQGLDRNITKRKRVERALRESEEKYRSIMESMDELTYICSSSFRIEYMNPAMVRKFGRDATGEICHQAFYSQNKPCLWCEHERVMQGKVVKSELVKPNSNEVYSVSHAPIFHTDGSVSKLSIHRDITAIKDMENRIHQAQKMESIGNLASGIAHDFNNILTPIIGMSELLLEDHPPQSQEYEYLSEILRAGRRGGDLVKQILSFSRQSVHELSPLRVQKVLKEVLKLVRATIPAYIRIITDVQADCGLVKADPTQIHQVAMNIITNASHAVDSKGGVIKVRLKEIVLQKGQIQDSLLAPGRYVHLSISDNGRGIPPEVLTKIFDPYFTTKKRGKGTGLGLAVAYGIIKKHRGEIKVSSQVGQGTTFNIYLPLMEKVDVKLPEKSPQALSTGHEHILLVDDETPIAKLEKMMLERLGYQVTMRVNSLEALEAFKANHDKFDLVMTDMAMPNMAGDELAKALMAIKPNIPVIITTGYSERITEANAKALGIKGFLKKPIIKSQMAEMVRRLLDEANEAAQT